jgi:hypothetical protein
LEIAQALGDFEALSKHSRPVIGIHLKGDLTVALSTLERACAAALSLADQPVVPTPRNI